jgi:phosphoribosylanthranilate isomerase
MRAADAEAAAAAGADFIGIMFAASSRRRVSVEEAALIAAAAGPRLESIDQSEPPPLYPGRFNTPGDWFAHGAEALDRLLARKRPLVVGVFADQPIDEIDETAEAAGLDLIQLSGDEPWSDALLATRQAIKVVRQTADATPSAIIESLEAGSALAVMLDSSYGSGTPGDWDVAADIAGTVPIWLAGGLRPENVGAAIARVRPWAVDVSTGVETGGVKDHDKIHAFVRAATAVPV